MYTIGGGTCDFLSQSSRWPRQAMPTDFRHVLYIGMLKVGVLSSANRKMSSSSKIREVKNRVPLVHSCAINNKKPDDLGDGGTTGVWDLLWAS